MLGIVMLGESNSGKSTIAHKVIDKLAKGHDINMRYISTGDIARRITTDNRLNEGKMADESTMRVEIIKEIRKSELPFILDGCPRFTDQYYWMVDAFRGVRFIYEAIQVPYYQIIERSRRRGRDDDGAIITKHQYFYDNTLPMIQQIFRDGNEIYLNHNPDNTDLDNLVDNMLKAILKAEAEEDEDSRI